MNTCNLSFVIVARNEAQNLARCLDSVMAAASEAQRSEIIFVDSRSQDESVAIALHYPIKILQLHPEQRVSSWAARFVGLQHARGELVQFIDGDMMLQKNWITNAAPYLLRDEQVVAVLGRLHEIYTAQNGAQTHARDVLRIADRVHENPRWVGGAMLCHHQRLLRLGSFNPFLYGEGEAEMCFRAELHQFKILALPLPMVKHYSASRDSWRELRRKYHNKMYMGFGQALRYHCKNPQVYKLLLRRRNHALALAFFFTGALACIAALFAASPMPVLIWLLPPLAYFVTLCLRSRKASHAFYNLATKALFLFGTLRGFLLKPLPVEDFPQAENVLKTAETDLFAEASRTARQRRAAHFDF